MIRKFVLRLQIQTAYKYCSVKAMLEILDHSRFFLSDSQHLNDSMESKSVAAVLKDSDSEFRLCYSSKQSTDDEPLIEPKNYRESERDIIPFHYLNFSEYKSIVKRIVLGPKCKLNKDRLRDYLRIRGYSQAVVTHSKASYR